MTSAARTPSVLRRLARERGYASAFVLTLGLGIGATTAIYSAVQGVLLRPLPYPHAHRIAYLQQPQLRAGVANAHFSFVEVADYRRQASTVEELVEYGDWEFSVVGRGEPHLASGGLVTSNYFAVLGLRPHLGRLLTAADDERTAAPVTVLTYEYWTSTFGSDPSIVGQAIELTGVPTTVVGVLEPGSHYAGTERARLYANYPTNAHYMSASMQEERIHRMTDVYALVRDGVPMDSARAELRAVAARLRGTYPDAYPAAVGYDVTLTPWREVLTREARPTFLILAAAVGLVLLVACANVGNLTLSRLVRRERELAVRVALGATTATLRRQLLAEHVVLALTGALLGLLIARGLLDALVSYAGRFTLRADAIALDSGVLAFAAAVAVVAAGVLALAPRLAFPGALPQALAAGTGGGGNTAGRRRRRSQRWLVVLQVAVAFVLLAGAGLLLRSFVNVQRLDTGLGTENVVTLRAPNATRRTIEQNRALFGELAARLAALPGVVSVASTSRLPFAAGSVYTWHLRGDGGGADAEPRRLPVVFTSVSPDYFRTLGIALTRGRGFDTRDTTGGNRTVLINQWLARYAFGEADPVGRRIQWSFDGGRWEDWRTVVGVVSDVRDVGVTGDATATIYEAAAQTMAGPGLVIRTAGAPGSIGRQAAAMIHERDPKRPVVDVRTIDEILAARSASWRLNASLFGVFAGLAMLVSAIGIGAVIAFTVSQRTREFGVRMALGADRARILRGVLGEGVGLAVAGIAIGALLAYLLLRLISGLLFGVTALDPVSYGAAAAALLAAAGTASYLPARRATRVEPTIALRAE